MNQMNNKKKIDDYMNENYRIHVYVEKNGFFAELPDLPGCMTEAESWNKLFVNIEDAKRGWIETALKNGITIPRPKLEFQEISSINYDDDMKINPGRDRIYLEYSGGRYRVWTYAGSRTVWLYSSHNLREIEVWAKRKGYELIYVDIPVKENSRDHQQPGLFRRSNLRR